MFNILLSVHMDMSSSVQEYTEYTSRAEKYLVCPEFINHYTEIIVLLILVDIVDREFKVPVYH